MISQLPYRRSRRFVVPRGGDRMRNLLRKEGGVSPR